MYNKDDDTDVNYLYTRSYFQSEDGNITPIANIDKPNFTKGTDNIYGVNVQDSYRGISSWNSKAIIDNTKSVSVKKINYIDIDIKVHTCTYIHTYTHT